MNEVTSGTVTVRAFDANAPIGEKEKQASRIWSSEGWLDCEAIDGATWVSAELGEAAHNARLVEFLESNDLDAYAQWLVLADGSLVAVQSIDLCDRGQFRYDALSTENSGVVDGFRLKMKNPELACDWCGADRADEGVTVDDNRVCSECAEHGGDLAELGMSS